MATTMKNGRASIEDTPDIRHIEIPKIEVRQAILSLVGVSPLISHNWSAKAIKMMEDAQTGKAKQQKAARIPDEEWAAAAYVVPGREDWKEWEPGKYCFPASAFKHAFLYGVSQLGDTKGMPKTKATGFVFVNIDPVLQFESVSLRTDIGRIGQGTATPIYRPQFNEWSVDLSVGYNGRAITLEQVIALFDLGGFAGGIGEWRPSAPKNKSGSYGRFRVSNVKSES